MAKKNPYVTTIGFNKEDPDHVYVADFLNSMGRGKGQYIVKAIMAYQNPDGMTTGHVVVPAVDYEKIRALVLRVLEERTGVNIKDKVEEKTVRQQENNSEKVEQSDMDEDEIHDIMVALSMFR